MRLHPPPIGETFTCLPTLNLNLPVNPFTRERTLREIKALIAGVVGDYWIEAFLNHAMRDKSSWTLSEQYLVKLVMDWQDHLRKRRP